MLALDYHKIFLLADGNGNEIVIMYEMYSTNYYCLDVHMTYQNICDAYIVFGSYVYAWICC